MSGYRLRLARDERGYTQQEVADAVGITRTAYTHYETGRNEITVPSLIKIADFYGCSTDELLGTDAFMKSQKRRKDA